MPTESLVLKLTGVQVQAGPDGEWREGGWWGTLEPAVQCGGSSQVAHLTINSGRWSPARGSCSRLSLGWSCGGFEVAPWEAERAGEAFSLAASDEVNKCPLLRSSASVLPYCWTSPTAPPITSNLGIPGWHFTPY
jgi:hypothetical protein